MTKKESEKLQRLLIQAENEIAEQWLRVRKTGTCSLDEYWDRLPENIKRSEMTRLHRAQGRMNALEEMLQK